MDSRGRITVPAPLGAHLASKPGDRLIWHVNGDGSFFLNIVPMQQSKTFTKR
jgi:bifunctional DNA-binding transcriptional regulator/antitoxin component of YhaV-PrlF toxin-antitoxin module